MITRFAIVALLAGASACTIELVDQGDDDHPIQDGGAPDAAPDAAPIDGAAAVCGDGVVQPLLGEVCDDGDVIPGDGCSSDCRSDETCGNGIVDFLDEQCDDAGWSVTCDIDCSLAVCGDGVVNMLAGEECDTHSDPLGCDDMCRLIW